jgi:hypothetical protein
MKRTDKYVGLDVHRGGGSAGGGERWMSADRPVGTVGAMPKGSLVKPGLQACVGGMRQTVPAGLPLRLLLHRRGQVPRPSRAGRSGLCCGACDEAGGQVVASEPGPQRGIRSGA